MSILAHVRASILRLCACINRTKIVIFFKFEKIWEGFCGGRLLGVGGFWWVLVGSFGFFWVLVGSFGFLWVLVGSGGFLWVLVGSGGGFGGFLWVLVGSYGFFWVLVGRAGRPSKKIPIRTHQNLSEPIPSELIRTYQNPLPIRTHTPTSAQKKRVAQSLD